MENNQSLQGKIDQGAQNSGEFFRKMAEFVGFDESQARTIFESRFIIEKYIPDIVSQFYINLLQYPPTRQFFLNADGSINQEYVQFRMSHLANFWRRTANGPYDDDYARYIDYVGHAHTKRGADPRIDIPERYVIGQVGFVQHAIAESISKELHSVDLEWEIRAVKAWNLLMMVILEMLARVYGSDDLEPDSLKLEPVQPAAIQGLAVNAYERSLGMHRLQEIQQTYYVAQESEIPIGERKLVKIIGISIGVFHQPSGWYAIQNKCLHAGGPVAEGRIRGETITCPWHGFQYDLPTGKLLSDPTARLEMFKVEITEGKVFVKLPVSAELLKTAALPASDMKIESQGVADLAKNEFRPGEIKPGGSVVVLVGGEKVVVFNIDGRFYAVDDFCTHAGGPLSEGRLDGPMVICPWHGSCFDVTTGEVLCGPAKKPVKTYQVLVEDEIGRVS